MFTKDKDTGGQRLNPILPRQIKSALGPEREILIAQKEKEIEELQKSIREDEEIANNENEQPSVRERAREKIAEKLEQIDAIENVKLRREFHSEKKSRTFSKNTDLRLQLYSWQLAQLSE